MTDFAAAWARGLYVRFNRTHVVPPLTISDEELHEA